MTDTNKNMSNIDRMHQAEAAAREATEKWVKGLAKHQVLGGYPLEVTDAAERAKGVGNE